MWDARAVIVLVLAVSVAAVNAAAVIVGAWQGRPITATGGEVLTAILGAVIAIIAAYVGRSNGETNGRGRTEARPQLAPDAKADHPSEPGLQPPTGSDQAAGQLEQGKKDAGFSERGP